jgi:uncharacterized cupin superfamily protein
MVSTEEEVGMKKLLSFIVCAGMMLGLSPVYSPVYAEAALESIKRQDVRRQHIRYALTADVTSIAVSYEGKTAVQPIKVTASAVLSLSGRMSEDSTSDTITAKLNSPDTDHTVEITKIEEENDGDITAACLKETDLTAFAYSATADGTYHFTVTYLIKAGKNIISEGKTAEASIKVSGIAEPEDHEIVLLDDTATITVTANAGFSFSSLQGNTTDQLFSIAYNGTDTAPTGYKADWCTSEGTYESGSVSSAGDLSVSGKILTMTPSINANADTYYFKVTSSDESGHYSDPITYTITPHDLTITGGTDDYTYTGGVLTITGAGDYTISNNAGIGTSTTDHIVVSATAGEVNLTLNGVNISTSSASGLSNTGGATTNITLADGTANTFTSTQESGNSTCGIYSAGDINISGSGTLNATGGTTAGYATYSSGIHSAKTLTINSGTINATGGIMDTGNNNNFSQGLYGDIVIINGGTIDSTCVASGKANNSSYGIYGNSQVKITDGNVTATGGTQTAGNSYGIRCKAGADNTKIEISGGTVIATGGTAYSWSCGLYNGSGNITVSGTANVTANGGKSTNRSNSDGIYGSLSVKDTAIVNATGGTATGGNDSYSCGVEGKVVISDNATLNATGGLATGSSGSNKSQGIIGTATINGGSLTAKGNNYASGSLVLTDYTNYVATGSTDVTGADPVTYVAANNDSYKYINVVPSYDISKPAATENGSFTVKVGDDEVTKAAADATVLITPAPANGYKLDAITVKETDGTQTVTVNADNTFTMPAYPVTVTVTFKEQDLTITGGTDYTYTGGVLTITGAGDYTISNTAGIGTSTTDHIVVSATTGEVNLTLNGVNISTSSAAGLSNTGGATMNITLAEDTANTFTSTQESGNSTCGIYSAGDINISGSGTLNATGGTTTGSDVYSSGIHSAKTLTINSGIINATGGEGNSNSNSNEFCYGLYGKSVIINGGTINATCAASKTWKNYSYGIYGYSKVKITDGIVTATGGEQAYSSYGIASKTEESDVGDIEIGGGTVIATGGTASQLSYGFELSIVNPNGNTGNITVSGLANVTANGGKSTQYGHSAGIYGPLNVKDTAIVNATGGTATGDNDTYSYGVKGEVVISDNATLNAAGGSATGGSGSNKSQGIIGTATINGGSLTAKGNNYASGSLVLTDYTNYVATGSTDVTGADPVTYVAANKDNYKYINIVPSYDISKPAATENGSFTVKVGDDEITKATAGTAVTVIPTPDTGYELDAITVKGTASPYTNVTVTNGSFTMPAYPVTVTVAFKKITVAITTEALANGVEGTAYTQTLAATGTSPIIWSISKGNFPAGLILNTATGAIIGTPSAAGIFSFTVKASNGADATKELTITVLPKVSISSASLDFGTVTYGSRPAAQQITVKNNTSSAINDIGVSGIQDSKFAYAQKIDAISANGSTTLDVQPKENLDAGTYTDTISFIYNGKTYGTANITFTVKKADQSAPSSVIGTNGTISGTTAAMEYSPNGTDQWKACSVGSTSVADGTWYVRYAEDKNHNASTAAKVSVVNEETKHTVSGTITSILGKPVGIIHRDVYIGLITVVGDSSPYTYVSENVPDGDYEMILTASDGTTHAAVTILVTVKGQNVIQNIAMPSKSDSSLVIVDGENTPNVEAGGLNIISDKLGEKNNKVYIQLFVQENENSANADEINKAISVDPAGMTKGMMLDLDLTKEINDNDPEKISELSVETYGVDTIKVVMHLPLSLQGKDGYALFRYHNGAVDKITETANADGEKIEISADKKTLTAYLKKFSTCAIAYKAEAEKTEDAYESPDTSVKNDAMMEMFALLISCGIAGAYLARRKKHQIEA